MPELDHKIIRPHAARCRQVKSSPNVWWTEGMIENRDIGGGLRGRDYPWLVFLCNDPECHAMMIVSIQSIVIATGEIEGYG